MVPMCHAASWGCTPLDGHPPACLDVRHCVLKQSAARENEDLARVAQGPPGRQKGMVRQGRSRGEAATSGSEGGISRRSEPMRNSIMTRGMSP